MREKSKFLFIIFCFLIFTQQLVFAFNKDDILFYASFDKGFKPDIAKGSFLFTLHGKPELCDGHIGKALLYENQVSGVVYELKGNFNPKQGTIAFWVSADNWRGDDPNVFQYYFSTYGGRPNIIIQHLWHYRSINFILFKGNSYVGGFPTGLHQGRIPTYDRSLADATSYLQKGIWYHIAFTWRAGEIASFLNGKEYGKRKDPGIKIIREGTKFCIGFPPYNAPIAFDILCDKQALPQLKKHWRTKIDEFVILRKRLFPSQITKLYQMGPVEYAKKQESDPSELSIANYPSLGFVKVTIVPGVDRKEIGKIEAALYPQNSDTPLERKTFNLNSSGIAIGKISTDSLKDGKYRVKAIIYDKQNHEISSSGFKEFEILHEVWWNNKIGLEDKLLPPWTPMELKKDTVLCWGREYRFDKSPFPKEIVTQKVQILSLPMKLVATIAGEKIRPVWEKPHFPIVKDTRIRRVQKGHLGTIDVEIDTTIEFDGLAIVDMRFIPKRKSTIDILYLDIPFKKENSIFMYRPGIYTGFSPKEKINFKTNEVWLGDDKIGFYWMTEDYKGWKLTYWNQSLEFIPGKDTSVLRVNFINKMAVLDKPFTIRFMYEATPVKPRPKNWRRHRMLHYSVKREGNKYNADLCLEPSDSWPAFSYSARPDPNSGFSSWKEYVESRKKTTTYNYILRSYGIKFLPYTNLCCRACRYRYKPNDWVPEYKRYSDEWKVVPENIKICKRSSGGIGHWYSVCPGSKLYRDYWTWQVVNVIIDKDVLDYDGLYFDIFNPRYCKHQEHGCGWIDEKGELQPSLPILGTRKLMRRIYAGVKAKKPDAILVGHCSGYLNMAYAAFVDMYFKGEEFRGSRLLARSGHYADIFRLDYARAAFTGKQFGVIPIHISEVAPQVKGKGKMYLDTPEEKSKQFKYNFYRGTRELMAILLLHDSLMFRQSEDPNALREAWNAHDRFGLGEEDVLFTGYWEIGDEIRCSNDKIKISYYKRPGKRVMLVVSNLTPLIQEFTITINPKKLDLPEGELIAIDGEISGKVDPLPNFDGRNLKIRVRDYDFKNIIIGGKEDMKEAMKPLNR